MRRRILSQHLPRNQVCAVRGMRRLIDEDAEPKRRKRGFVETASLVRTGDQGADPAIADNVANALGWSLSVKGDINASRLYHAQHGDDRLHTLRKVDAYSVALAHATLLQKMR